MGRELFGSGRPGYEIEKRFAADYRGMPISWRGTILKQRPGYTELVVAEIEDRLFGRSSIVVAAGASAPPGAVVGDEVVLDGTAAEIDYLDRKVKVEEATLRS